MSLLKPKTIIITGQPPCQYGSAVVTSTVWDLESLQDDRLDSSDDESYNGVGPKKRRRLTYLTPEEKLVRRYVGKPSMTEIRSLSIVGLPYVLSVC